MSDDAVPLGSAAILRERLALELRPVRRRDPKRDGMVAAALCLAELGLFLMLGMKRHDMAAAMGEPSLWWKGASTLGLALIGGATALVSLDPSRSARPGLRLVGLALAVVFGVGWLVDALNGTPGVSLAARLDWPHGLQCASKMAVLAVPPALLFGLLARRGAPTDPDATALAAGLGAACWGAFVFVFACPKDDPLYLALWYTVGCGAVIVVVRSLLPRLIRW